MNHVYHKPAEQLTAYVRTILLLDGSNISVDNPLPAFTNGMPALCCKTEKDGAGLEHILEITLVTSKIPDSFWSMNAYTSIVVYFFKPFVLTPLFNVAAKELNKNPIRLDTWSPHIYTALKTQLIYANTITAKLEALDNLMIQQHLKNQDVFGIIQYATDAILLNPSIDILNEILTELNLKERTFQRIFKKYVGITPTQFRRISQFQGSFDQLRSKKFEKISDVAFDNGFADQSHFIRSFKEFTHTTPNDYLNNGLTDKK